jgi:hypothetical protein
VTLYKVTGKSFQSYEHGDEFEADLDPGLEQRAKARGQLRVVKRKPQPEEEEATADAEADSPN